MVNENKLGKAAAQKTQPYSKVCRICNTSLHQQANYCTNCAYKKGSDFKNFREFFRVRIFFLIIFLGWDRNLHDVW
jgi:ribosomal protein L40E